MLSTEERYQDRVPPLIVGRFRRCTNPGRPVNVSERIFAYYSSDLGMNKLLLIAPAWAQTGEARVKVGTLSCHEKSGWGFIFGSSHAVRCTFSNGARVERYDGSISKFGLDVGYQQSGVLLWEVVAPTDHFGSGALAGHYGGLTAGATVGVGLAANALVGGSTTNIALQPLSIEGSTGLNLAAGIADLTLHPHDGM
jgi:hypothetical protein